MTYLDGIPTSFFSAACVSAGFSFVISSLMGRNVRVGFTSALLATVASIIGSLVTPLLKPDHFGYIDWKKATISQLTNLGMLQFFGRYTDAYSINFFASAFFTLLAINLNLQGEYTGIKMDVDDGPVFIIV